MVSLSTMTSMGRPEGALKYIWRSPFRLLNLRSGSQPAFARYSATFLRSLATQAKSMSWPERCRGGNSGQSTRTARPPRSLRPSEASAAPRASPSASGSGSSAGEGAPAAPGVVMPACSHIAAAPAAAPPGSVLLSEYATMEFVLIASLRGRCTLLTGPGSLAILVA